MRSLTGTNRSHTLYSNRYLLTTLVATYSSDDDDDDDVNLSMIYDATSRISHHFPQDIIYSLIVDTCVVHIPDICLSSRWHYA